MTSISSIALDFNKNHHAKCFDDDVSNQRDIVNEGKRWIKHDA